jgi:hypothetical protein
MDLFLDVLGWGIIIVVGLAGLALFQEAWSQGNLLGWALVVGGLIALGIYLIDFGSP